MSKVKAKNTKPEMLVRQFLFQMGLRFRIHDPKLPGKPDLKFTKYIFTINRSYKNHKNVKNIRKILNSGRDNN